MYGVIRKSYQTKMYDIIFFNYWIISSAGSLLASEISYFLKNTLQSSADHHARWPLCKLWEHSFSVPDLVCSPPHLWFRCWRLEVIVWNSRHMNKGEYVKFFLPLLSTAWLSSSIKAETIDIFKFRFYCREYMVMLWKISLHCKEDNENNTRYTTTWEISAIWLA